jgi:histone H3/H4
MLTEDIDEENKNSKRKFHKKSRFFDLYISKTLKQVCKNEITLNARNQLNNILIIIIRLITEKTHYLVGIGKKKTISILELENSIKFLFHGELQKVILQEGYRSIENFKNNDEDKKGNSRQTKAEILFPPSICEKFLRKFNTSNLMVSCDTPVFLAGTLEYICAEILDLSSGVASYNNRVRITVRDLEIAIRTDEEFNSFFNQNNIQFIGGGIIPFINPVLLNKRRDKSIKKIKDIQEEGDCLIFPKYPFEKVVRNILNENSSDLKISKNFLIALQYLIEQEMVSLLQKANNLAIYTGRLKLIPSDIEMILSIEENRLPNFLVKDETESSSDSDFNSTEPPTPLNSP